LALKRLERLSEAADEFRLAYHLAPVADLNLQLRLLEDLTMTLCQLGEWDEALWRIDDALQLSPNDRKWLTFKRDTLTRAGREAEEVVPRQDNRLQVFISYSRTDSLTIDRLETSIRDQRFRIWIDHQHLEGGDAWVRLIADNITQCDVFLVVLSPQSVASAWVNREILYALDMNKTIIPITLLAGTRPPLSLIGI
jgi:hypothetical protein